MPTWGVCSRQTAKEKNTGRRFQKEVLRWLTVRLLVKNTGRKRKHLMEGGKGGRNGEAFTKYKSQPGHFLGRHSSQPAREGSEPSKTGDLTWFFFKCPRREKAKRAPSERRSSTNYRVRQKP